MDPNQLPFSIEQIREAARDFPTPFHLYDEAGIRATAQRLNAVFDWVQVDYDDRGYINHFAVKATPNPYILEILKDETMGADVSSGPEIELAAAVGLQKPLIIFTSNNTPPEEYVEAHRAGAIINLDDINQIDVLRQALGGDFPDTISFRYNPGNEKGAGVNSIIDPEEAKFGVPDKHLEACYRRAQELGAKHFGLHSMVVTNGLDASQHIATAKIVFGAIADLSDSLGINFEFANLGGGLGIPYRPEDQPLDYSALKRGIASAYKELILGNGLSPLRVLTEYGRHVTGPNGYLVSRVRSIKDTYHRYVGLDASMADLMRPGMYNAHHEITVLGKRTGKTALQRVVGGLCENNDHFTGGRTKERELPVMKEGDIVVIHNAGAHGHSKGFNYNGKLRSAELLLQANGSIRKIRDAETRDNLFATLNYPGLAESKR